MFTGLVWALKAASDGPRSHSLVVTTEGAPLGVLSVGRIVSGALEVQRGLHHLGVCEGQGKGSIL